MSAQLETLVLDSDPFEKQPGIPLPAPKECEDNFRDLPNVLSAYQACLELEQHAMEDTKAMSKSKSRSTKQNVDLVDTVVRARILGYLLLYAPSQRALGEVVNDIHSCNKEYDKLLELGDCFFNSFIRPFRKHKGRTPVLSDQSSCPSYDVDTKSITAKLEEEPKNYVEAKQAALYRDGYRCIVSGIYDISASAFGISVQDIINAGYPVYTECAHIVPESTYFNVTEAGGELKAGYAASVLAVLKRFGYSADNFDGPIVHSLYNVITMEKNTHDRFDQLELWFEPTKIPNQYKPTAFSPLLPLPETVKFTSPDPEHFPVPSPEFLALHAICCKVALMSGAAKYLDKYDRDMDDLGVLDPDGTSSGVLRHAIWENLGRSVDVGAHKERMGSKR